MLKKVLLLVFIFFTVTVFAQEHPSKSDEELKLDQESSFLFSKFVILPLRQNYLLPLTYNTKPNFDPFARHAALGNTSAYSSLGKSEAKFQLSIKLGVKEKVFTDSDTFYFGYTQQSYWQVYNVENSRPFRETNYEPEFFWEQRLEWHMGPFKLDLISIGLVHQSNGQSSNLTRSWNRIYTMFTVSQGHFLLIFKPWYRFKEKEAKNENSDLENYAGHFDLTLAYNLSGNTLTLLHRNNFKTKKQLYIAGWSFPLSQRVKGFFQYVYGYSENLLDYNKLTNKVGVGIIFSDLL